ncbi:MAG: N-acetylmuramoyl-L-alanine amidase [Oscillospiraceae bacterium]|nr:N-acetylmuramoyl-L-alanine amidase [Oscillospiraceae bacterium]
MPSVFLSPSTQEWNPYVNGGNEELYMNQVADRMEPYLRSSGIVYRRNDPNRGAAGAIADSNAGNYDVHLALHSNAAPESLSGQLRGIDIYYSPVSRESEELATIIANNFKMIYPLPDKSNARPTSSLGEVTRTNAVAVLCELGYHDNVQDAAWIKNNLNAIAVNLVESLCDYFGIPFVSAGPVRTGIVTAGGSNLNIRSYPSMNGRIIGSIPDGAKVTVYGKTDNWYVIFYQGVTGYVSGEFLSV